jgi:hypothetical protein
MVGTAGFVPDGASIQADLTHQIANCQGRLTRKRRVLENSRVIRRHP